MSVSFAKLDKNLRERFSRDAADSEHDFLVVLAEEADVVKAKRDAPTAAIGADRVVAALKETASRSQAGVKEAVSSRGGTHGAVPRVKAVLVIYPC